MITQKYNKLMNMHIFLIEYSLNQVLLWNFLMYGSENNVKYHLFFGVSFPIVTTTSDSGVK